MNNNENNQVEENSVSTNLPDKELMYWARKYDITGAEVAAALAKVGNNQNLLEGFLKKNIPLH